MPAITRHTVKLRLHRHPGRPAHGPQAWPWWRLISFSYVRLGQGIGTSTGYGRRVWCYTRWHWQWMLDLTWPKSDELIALHQLAIDVNWCKLYGQLPESKHRDCQAMIDRSLARVLEIAKELSAPETARLGKMLDGIKEREAE